MTALYVNVAVNMTLGIPCPSTIERLVEGCRCLVEAVASRIDTIDDMQHEDLVQTGYVVVMRTIASYDPCKGRSLYAYLAKSMRNAMLNEVRDHGMVELDDTVPVQVFDEASMEMRKCISQVVGDTPLRFPSISATAAVEVAEYVVAATIDEAFRKSAGIVRTLLVEHSDVLDRKMVTVMYHSTLVRLRAMLLDVPVYSVIPESEETEWTLIPEMIVVLGDDMYVTMRTVFKGMYVKL